MYQKRIYQKRIYQKGIYQKRIYQKGMYQKRVKFYSSFFQFNQFPFINNQLNFKNCSFNDLLFKVQIYCD